MKTLRQEAQELTELNAVDGNTPAMERDLKTIRTAVLERAVEGESQLKLNTEQLTQDHRHNAKHRQELVDALTKEGLKPTFGTAPAYYLRLDWTPTASEESPSEESLATPRYVQEKVNDMLKHDGGKYVSRPVLLEALHHAYKVGQMQHLLRPHKAGQNAAPVKVYRGRTEGQ